MKSAFTHWANLEAARDDAGACLPARRGWAGEGILHMAIDGNLLLYLLHGIGPIQTIPGGGKLASIAYARYDRIMALYFEVQADVDIPENGDNE